MRKVIYTTWHPTQVGSHEHNPQSLNQAALVHKETILKVQCKVHSQENAISIIPVSQ